jgi:hypothetical protein
MEKGLFNSFFVLIMLILSSSTLFIETHSQDMLDNYNYLNQLTLASDQAIVDAIFEQTYSNSCTLDDASNYNNLVKTYINNIISDTSSLSSISCDILELDSSISSDNYIGYIDIRCEDNTSPVFLNITKRFEFSKNIDVNSTSGCRVVIKDNFDFSNVQLDITRT